MRFINRERQSGKSSIMVSTTYTMRIPIVVDTISRKENLKSLAYKMGCNDVEIYTADEIREKHFHVHDVLIDESDNLIQKALNEYLGTNVIAASLSLDMDRLPHPIMTIDTK